MTDTRLLNSLRRAYKLWDKLFRVAQVQGAKLLCACLCVCSALELTLIYKGLASQTLEPKPS